MIAEQLRKAVLQAAIQGRLTEQVSEDGNACELLEEIRAEKERLIKEGKIKKEKPLPQITEYEIPFEIPENWAWSRLGSLTIINPRNKIADDTLVSFIPMKHIDDGYSNNFSYESRVWGDIKSGFTHFSNNDVVIAKITPCFQNRKSAVMRNLKNGFGAGTTELHVVRPLCNKVESNYFLYLFKTEYFIGDGVISMTGTAGQKRVGSSYIQNFLCPIPPISEQQRIINKIQDLLQLIDDLEKDEIKLDDLQKLFPTQMKSSILQAAIQGRLTEQLPEDGDARVLLKEIMAEKERLIKDGKIKKEKPLPKITEDEIPFEIPENWRWVRLGNLVNVQTGSKDANWGSINGQYKFYTCAKEPILSHTYSFEGKSIIMPGNGANVGLSLLIDEKFEAYQRTYVLQSVYEKVYLDFIHVVLNADWKDIYGGGVYGSAIPYIRKGELTNYVAPLPPLAEQQRIVKRLEELVPLCDALK